MLYSTGKRYTAEEKAYDAGKKISEISGIKRHIAVDTQGLPHVIHVTTANVTDREGALEAFQYSGDRIERVVNVLVGEHTLGNILPNLLRN